MNVERKLIGRAEFGLWPWATIVPGTMHGYDLVIEAPTALDLVKRATSVRDAADQIIQEARKMPAQV